MAVLLQPQALAQHLLHGLADRIAVAAGDRLDFGPGVAQPRLQAVGGVQQLAERALALAAPAAVQQHDQGEDHDEGGQQHEDRGQEGGHPAGEAAVCPGAAGTGKSAFGAAVCRDWRRLTPGRALFNILRLMSTDIPEILDAWRMVAARRGFTGRLPLSAMPRLRDALLDCEGEVAFALQFDRDALQVPYVELRIDAALPLQCQRTLQRFELPVAIVQRLGLIAAGGDEEVEEAALPEGYEALQVPEDGMLRPAELVEDELILAIPVVPVQPGSEAVERDWPVQADEELRANPFAALQGLKKH